MCIAELGAQTALTPQAPPELLKPHGTHTCFRSRPLPACDAFWLTEFGIGLRMASATSPYPSGTLFTWELGWMKNRGPWSAGGAAVFLGVPDQGGGGAAIGIRPRLRRWLSATTSLDIAPGVVLVHPGSVNYAPAFSGHADLNLSDWCAVTTHVQVGSQLDPTATVSRTSVSWFAGGRLGAVPGAVTAVAVPLVAIIALVIVCSGGHCFE
jgi:hypothetical protein